VGAPSAPAGDQPARHRPGGAGGEPLDQALRSPDVGADARSGDRGDERVEEGHDLRGEDDEQGDPAPAVRGRVGGDGGGGRLGGGGHGFPRTTFVDGRTMFYARTASASSTMFGVTPETPT